MQSKYIPSVPIAGKPVREFLPLILRECGAYLQDRAIQTASGFKVYSLDKKFVRAHED